MKRLITILAVFSLACLSAGVAYAESAPPTGYDIIDFVDIGDTTTSTYSETGHNLVEWGPSFDADAFWSFTGNSAYYRQIWGWTTPPGTYPPGEDSENWATIELDFTKPSKSGQMYIGFFFLAGAGDDNFYVYIDGTLIGEVTETETGNTMVREYLSVPNWVTAGTHTVKLECSEPAWASQATYGQVTIDEIYTFTGDQKIEPVPEDGTTIGCVDGTKLVDFAFTKGYEEIRGYSVRVQCTSELSFHSDDITVYTVPGGAQRQFYFTRNDTCDWTIDYAILGGSTGIPDGVDLFTVEFHGAGEGTGTVSMDSARLSALDGTPVDVDHTTTADIVVDCTAPGAPTMTAEPTYTAGTANTVYWSDESASAYFAQRATDAGFTTDLANSGWIAVLNYQFTGLDDDQIYHYRVMARDDLLNESPWSNVESSTQDDSPPATAAAVTDPGGDGWVESFFDVTYSGSDATSGIASVELWYQIGGGGYNLYGTFVGTTINFDASAMAEGTYDFYTIATDNVGNEEAVPGSPDASIDVDKTPPATHVVALGAITVTASFTVSYILDTEVGSGLFDVELWYQKGTGGSYTKYATFTGTSMTFDSSTTGDDGTYYFYSIGTDNVGNEEVPPTGPDYDTFTLVDTAGPDVTSFLINGVDTYTNSTSVTLYMDVSDVVDMQFTNDNLNWPGGWVSYATTYPWTLTSGDGTKTVYARFRDSSAIVANAQDDIFLDTAAPVAVSDIAAQRGHNKITVTWTNPVDGETSAEVWRHMWYYIDTVPDTLNAYPEYDDVHDYTPTRPASRAAALTDPLWVRADSSAVPGTPFVDNSLARGIYHYEVFVQDAAGNWSLPAADNAHNLSYLLGDVSVLDDGAVTLNDISVLGAAYGTSDAGGGAYDNECDVGPTDDYSGAGIPDTDDLINFDDLMIFALNWEVTVSKTQPTGGSMIARFSWVKIDDTTWSLVLAEPCANLKGVNLQADLAQDAVLSVNAGSLLGRQDSPYFLQNIPGNGLDAGLALLGKGACITGQGELIRITLAGELDPEDILIVARDSANKDLEYSLEEAAAIEDMPTRYELSANYPNPFNPSTKIDFALPESQHVRLAIFAIDGRRIATLKNESMSAGRHSVTWMGRDDQGGLVAAGIYFYRIQAGEFSRTQKMTLLK